MGELVSGGSAGGGGFLPEFSSRANLYSRPTGEGAHALDEEFATAGAHGGTAVDVTGTIVGSKKSHLLTVAVAGQSANDVGVIVYPLTGIVAAPVTLETVMSANSALEANPMHGICFTDGVAAGSKIVSFGYIFDATDVALQVRQGTLTAFSTSTASKNTSGSSVYGTGQLWLRLVWSAADTFKVLVSTDGEGWNIFNFAASYASTITPTHFGVYGTAWAGTTTSHAGYEFLRIDESDKAS